MRYVGQIDITMPRWRERRTTRLPMILANIKTLTPGAGEPYSGQRLPYQPTTRRLRERAQPSGTDLEFRFDRRLIGSSLVSQ